MPVLLDHLALDRSILLFLWRTTTASLHAFLEGLSEL